MYILIGDSLFLHGKYSTCLKRLSLQDGIDLARLQLLDTASPRAPINWGEAGEHHTLLIMLYLCCVENRALL